MNLAWLQASGSMTANERASILHEFGHVLGLLHEHQIPAHGGTAINRRPPMTCIVPVDTGQTSRSKTKSLMSTINTTCPTIRRST